MPYSAIIFDLDGTLLDTLADLAEGMNAVLDSMGLPVHPQAAYRYFVGNGLRELALRVLPEGRRDEKTAQECLDAMRIEYDRRWANKTRPFEHIVPLLSALQTRGVIMAVLSNKPHEIAVKTIRHFFPAVAFAAVEGDKETRPRKPDPAGAFEIARKTGIATDKFIYCGDTNTDMQTAFAAGMTPVGVLWGFRTKEELIKSGAKIVVKDPLEILNIFKL